MNEFFTQIFSHWIIFLYHCESPVSILESCRGRVLYEYSNVAQISLNKIFISAESYA